MKRRQFVVTAGTAALGISSGRRFASWGRTAPAGQVLADGIGVNMRLGDMTPDKLALAHDIGFRWLRTDVAWAQVEGQSGSFYFSAHQAAFGRAKQLGFRMLGILDYGHPVHTQGRAPATDTERTAFVAFARRAEAELGATVDAWEIWNEPNYKGLWSPSPSPADFAALVRDAALGIWALNSQRQLVAGGLAGLDMAFLSAITPTLIDVARHGPLAGSFHPYRAAPPETFAADLVRLGLTDSGGRAWIAPGVPLWVSEWGYCRLRENLGEGGQAEMDVRLPLVTAAMGVPVTILFELIDPRVDQIECGQSYGIHAAVSLRPHTASIALQQFIRHFGRQTLVGTGLLRRGMGWGLKTSGGEIRWSSSTAPVIGTTPVAMIGDTLTIGSSRMWVDGGIGVR